MLQEAYEVALKLARKRSAVTEAIEASNMMLNDHGERLENTYENVENAREEVAASTAYPYAENPIQVFLG
ncbi:hypothetical protein ABN764_15445 [Paenibacillaceae sp. P-4]|uniref:hypothetical protein n=1 Tax=Paenibacillaceae bacterium P-4 TaxID=3160969 RepID=UPI0032E811EA